MADRSGIAGIDSDSLNKETRRVGFPARVWEPTRIDSHGRQLWASREPDREDLARRLAAYRREAARMG